MKKKIIFLLLLPLSSFICTAAMAELSNQELAQEIVHCYVAHEREQTHMYTSGKAEKMKVLINGLVGKESADEKILIANTQRNQQKDKGYNQVVIPAVKKYCLNLDHKLSNYKK